MPYRFTKKVYFVRHGQSEGNAAAYVQDTHTPLNDKGKEQASFIAERCANLPIEAIISSSMKRASATAQIIGNRIGQPVEPSDLFVERRRPSSQWNQSRLTEEFHLVDDLIKANFHDDNFHFSDEENFQDLKSRAAAALDLLQNRPETHLLVVTHNFFMKILLAYVTFGDALTSREAEKIIGTFWMENAGLTVIGYDENHTDDYPAWTVWVWNDHTHLG